MFYSTQAWKKLRAKIKRQWLIAQKPCAYCHKPMHLTDRLIVDHIKPIHTHPHLKLEPQNLCVMHWDCHSKKTRNVDHNPREQIGYDGLPESWG